MKLLPKDLQSLETRDLYKILSSCITPRPIAFVSTLNKNGLPNAAPFCFFMGVTPSPPTIAFSVMRRGEEQQKKDTVRNIETSREFVVNVVDEALANAMNIASGSFPPDMSEFDLTGLTPTESDIVKPPRIGESPISMECKLRCITDLGDLPASIIVGEVVCFHIKDQLWVPGQGADVSKIKTIGRMGETLYCKTSELFELNRPA